LTKGVKAVTLSLGGYEMDRRDLKIEHYKQRVAELSVQYEERIADLRVELTEVSDLLQQKNQELEELKAADEKPEEDS